MHDPDDHRPFEDIPLERQHVEAFPVLAGPSARTAVRAEQRLVLAYGDYMASKGVEVVRRRYWPKGEATSLASDAWVPARGLLLEAKAGDGRDAVRQAVGQLYDYKRFHTEAPGMAVLLPYKPRPDRLALLQSAGIEAAWQTSTGFTDSARRRFT